MTRTKLLSHCHSLASYHHHPFVLTIMKKKGNKKAADAHVHLPGGALQTTFALEGAYL